MGQICANIFLLLKDRSIPSFNYKFNKHERYTFIIIYIQKFLQYHRLQYRLLCKIVSYNWPERGI